MGRLGNLSDKEVARAFEKVRMPPANRSPVTHALEPEKMVPAYVLKIN